MGGDVVRMRMADEDNFIAKLRQKLETSPRTPEHILTVYRAGYKFVG